MIGSAVLFLLLGLDTFAVAIGLGMAGLPRARWLLVGLTFAAFEGLMPVLGLLVGQRLSAAAGTAAAYLAAALLILLGLSQVREALAGDADDDLASAVAAAHGRALVLTGLSVSLDELAVGFSLGVLGVPLGPALAYIAVQAFAVTFIGLRLGRRLGAHLGEWAALAAGVALALLGVALAVQKATGR